MSFGVWLCVVWRTVSDVSKYHSVHLQGQTVFLTIYPWRWRHYDPSKRRKLLAERHSVTYHKYRHFDSLSVMLACNMTKLHQFKRLLLQWSAAGTRWTVPSYCECIWTSCISFCRRISVGGVGGMMSCRANLLRPSVFNHKPYLTDFWI